MQETGNLRSRDGTGAVIDQLPERPFSDRLPDVISARLTARLCSESSLTVSSDSRTS